MSSDRYIQLRNEIVEALNEQYDKKELDIIVEGIIGYADGLWNSVHSIEHWSQYTTSIHTYNDLDDLAKEIAHNEMELPEIVNDITQAFQTIISCDGEQKDCDESCQQ